MSKEIFKSFVPGKGWVKAAQMTREDRGMMHLGLQVKGVHGGKGEGLRGNASSKGREIHPGLKTSRGKLKTIQMAHRTNGEGHSLQGVAFPDGRGGGTVAFGPTADLHTATHEMQHIAPKRNPHNLMRRIQDPVRHGREEGRADFLTHKEATPGQYPGTPEFKQGYNEVQTKMGQAAYRKRLNRDQKVKKSLEIFKARKRDTAMQVTGAGTTVATLNRHGIERKYNQAVDNHFNRRKAKVESAWGFKGKKPVDKPVQGAGPKVKAEYKAYRRARFTKLNNLNRMHNKASFHLGGARQSYTLAAAGIGGAALAYKGTRNKLSKAWTKQKADHAALGAAAGAGAYQGATYALKPVDRYYESKIKAGDKPTSNADKRRILSEHKKKTGLPKNAKLGDGRYREYFRTYPKELPGAKFKRVTAVTHTGKSGVALTTGAGVAGAAAALHHFNRRHVSKGFTPWDGVSSEVSKMSPDPSEVHVIGTGRRRGRLRRTSPQQSTLGM